MTKYFIILFIMTKMYGVTNLPSHSTRSKDISATFIVHRTEANAIPMPTRKKKGPTIPLSLQMQHQLWVPNLHVIPISSVQHHTDNVNIPVISHVVSHNRNKTQPQLIQVLIPFHNLVPVHELTVIPLHGVNEQQVAYRRNENEDRYRNPLGGYGVGWGFGGHGAGHGFHYSYG